MKITDEMVRVMIHQTFFPLPGESLSQEVYEEHEPHFRRGLEAALNAAPVAGDAPTDAEFEAALDEWFKAESAANWYRRNGLVGHFTADERAEAEARWELVIAEAESTRQRILALYADARNAGLRELRAWCEARQEWTTVLDSDHYVYMSILNQITAMLKGGDGA